MHFTNKRIFWLLIAVLLLAGTYTYGQDRKVRKAERKQELVKKLEKKYYQKIRKKTIRHRREIQTKATQKRMKETDKKARKYNRQNRECWIEQHLFRTRPKR
jgi:uncharacterized protein HemX